MKTICDRTNVNSVSESYEITIALIIDYGI